MTWWSKILTLLQGVKWGTTAMCLCHSSSFSRSNFQSSIIFPTRQLMTTMNPSTPILIRLFIYNYPRFIKQKNIKHINILNIFNSFQFIQKALRFQPTSSKSVDKLVPPGSQTHFNRTIVTPKILSVLMSFTSALGMWTPPSFLITLKCSFKWPFVTQFKFVNMIKRRRVTSLWQFHSWIRRQKAECTNAKFDKTLWAWRIPIQIHQSLLSDFQSIKPSATISNQHLSILITKS